MMKRSLYAVIVVAAFGAVAHAGGHNDAGCGLGSMLFKEDKPIHQIVAATTNGTSGNQTFGITTGTLGCSSGGLIKTSKERAVFTATNFRALEKEFAAGKGQYSASLAAMSGCQLQAFQTFVKARYEHLIPSAATTPVQLLNNLDREISEDAAMSKACGA